MDDLVERFHTAATQVQALGDAIASSFDDTKAMLDYVRRRARALCGLGDVLPAASTLCSEEYLRLVGTLAAIDEQTECLRQSVAARRDRLGGRLLRVRQRGLVTKAYARSAPHAAGWTRRV